MKVEREPLNVGDTVSVSVTHEIKVGGETSWIKYGATTQVRNGETAEDARDRASGHVNAGVMKVLQDTVDEVRKH